MNVNQLFSHFKKAVFPQDLEHVTMDTYKNIKSKLHSTKSYDDVLNLMNELGLDNNKLYNNKNDEFESLWYIDNFMFFEIYQFSYDFLVQANIRNIVKNGNEKLSHLWNNKEYDSFFRILEQRFTFLVFQEHINEISDKDVYRVFRDIYVKNEYGFKDIDKDLVRKVFSLNQYYGFRKKLKTDKNGFLTIYRGISNLSTDINEAYSWTLDFNTAVYFATRFNSVSSEIYQAKVHVNDIVDFINTRNEKEILLLPENLKDVKKLDLYNFNADFVHDLHTEGYIEQYNVFKSLLQDGWFLNPNGIHGIMHVRRTLLLTTILSYYEVLNQRDSDILAYSSIFHDIGRIDDSCDNEHGIRSIEKMDSLNLERLISKNHPKLNEEDISIIKYIIKNHAISDEESVDNVNNEELVTDKSRAIKLMKLFKDADGLDRVRIHDLDRKYLRSDSAKKLILVAHQVLINLR